MAKHVPGDWQRIYAHPAYPLETFVDPERFRGTCYRVANWVTTKNSRPRCMRWWTLWVRIQEMC
jgi:hypothetical protein